MAAEEEEVNEDEDNDDSANNLSRFIVVLVVSTRNDACCRSFKKSTSASGTLKLVKLSSGPVCFTVAVIFAVAVAWVELVVTKVDKTLPGDLTAFKF